MKKIIIFLLASISVVAMAQGPRGQAGQSRQAHSPEQRAILEANRIANQLELNESQKQKVHVLVLDKIAKIKTIRSKYPNDKKAALLEIQPIRKDFNAQLKTILTEAQYTKWQQIKAERKSKYQEQQKAQQNDKQISSPPTEKDILDELD